jgi:hypothetical protein
MEDQALDFDLLADFFPAPAKKKRKAKREYEFNGRRAIVEKYGARNWEGYFDDDHSVTFIAETKHELLADMQAEA